MKAQPQTNTEHEVKPFEPVRVYHEGVFDKKYWYTLQTKIYIKRSLHYLDRQMDSIFIEHKIAR